MTSRYEWISSFGKNQGKSVFMCRYIETIKFSSVKRGIFYRLDKPVSMRCNLCHQEIIARKGVFCRWKVLTKNYGFRKRNSRWLSLEINSSKYSARAQNYTILASHSQQYSNTASGTGLKIRHTTNINFIIITITTCNFRKFST